MASEGFIEDHVQVLEFCRGGQEILKVLWHGKVDLLTKLLTAEVVRAVFTSEKQVMVNYLAHEHEYAVHGRKASCLFASFKCDKHVDVLFKNALGQVFLLLSHLYPDDDLLPHRQVFEHLSFEPA